MTNTREITMTLPLKGRTVFTQLGDDLEHMPYGAKVLEFETTDGEVTYKLSVPAETDEEDQTSVMLLLTPVELHDLAMIVNRYVPLDRSESVGAIRAKVNNLMEVM